MLLRSVIAAVVLACSTLAHSQTAQEPFGSLGELWAPKADWNAPEPWRTDRWYFQTSLYTWHFHYDANHKQALVLDSVYGLNERWLEGETFVGFTLFTNSFGQFSQFLYGGLKWRPVKEHQPFYVKLAAGVLHGYSGEYKDKIPYNSTGFAPAIVPGVGYCWVRYCTEAILLGGNAMLFTVGMSVP
jgi:hypothetical protein